MLLRFTIFCAKIAFILFLIGLIIGTIVVWIFSRDLPDHSELDQYYPPSITRMYSADGKLIEEFAREHRIFVPIESVPKTLSLAFIAAEDKNFYLHPGIDVFGIVRAGVRNFRNSGSRMHGASTITQQVVRNFLLSSERSFTRKIKEAILSYRISGLFTKEEVLELYLNQIYLGKGAHGVATAALHYFNKSVEELTLNECAFLAALPKAPASYDPSKNYKKAFYRKNYVLTRMYEDGYITKDELEETKKEPITLAKFDKVQTVDADYYAAKVRAEIIDMFGEEYFYTAGLTVMTCANSKMQDAASAALRTGVKEYDMKRGYRGPLRNIGVSDWKKKLSELKIPKGLRDYKMGVVLNVSDSEAKVGLKDGKRANIYLKDMKWTATNIRSVKKILKAGDVIVVEIKEGKYFLQQIPKVNGGIMVVEHSTGRVLAAEGGYDFDGSNFDRTTQANRQPGSLIKPFVYYAALEKGARPNDIFSDGPVDVYQGKGMPIWRPKNYAGKDLGPMTLRKGLEKSRNTVTVRVGQVAGLSKVVRTIKRFGVNDDAKRRHSIVLGSMETTLKNITMAYGSIANGGKKIEPHYIEWIKDRKGNVIYKRDYAECNVCKSKKTNSRGQLVVPRVVKPNLLRIADPAVTYQVSSILQGGIQRGTGVRARHLKHKIGGKTGTTNSSKDAWFMGFTPKIVVGTYMGFDNPRTLGKRATGSSLALPIFVDFMTNGYADQPVVDFPVPDTIELRSIDRHTGEYATGPGTIMEAFRKYGYKPGVYRTEEKEPEIDDNANVEDSSGDGDGSRQGDDNDPFGNSAADDSDEQQEGPASGYQRVDDDDPFSRIQDQDQSHELY